MDIYRLSDGSPVGCKLKITGMKQGVKNPERVNIFVDGKFSFSLDVSQVVDFKLKVGRELNEEELAEFRKASEFGKLYQRALEKALTRPHSKKEIHDYLSKKVYEKGLDKKYIDEIIEKLENKKYLDDKKFAEFYVENRFVKKGISKKRLRLELMKKGVLKDIIDEVLDGRNEEEEIEKMILKKRAKYDDEKLVQYLYRQGFSYELAREKVAEVGGEVRDVD